MIPQERVNEAAKVANDYTQPMNIDAFYDGFDCGIRFAEAELKQTTIEFAEWIFDNNFRMILVANDKCYVRSSDDTTLILTKAALFAKFEAERNQQQSELTCPECLSNRILEWPDKYQCRKCEHV